MNAYAKNVERALAGLPKRPAITRDGRPQRRGNLRYRYVHLVLAAAEEYGWPVEHYPLENCSKSCHVDVETQRKIELACNMNDGPSWMVEDFTLLSAELQAH